MIQYPPRYRPRSHNIHPVSPEAIMGTPAADLNEGGWASAAWPSTDMAIFYPFTLTEPSIAVKLWSYNGTVVGDDMDLGVYAADGTKLVSIGATTQSGTSNLQLFDITDTLLPAGVTLYMGVVVHGTTSTLFRMAGNVSLEQLRTLGMFQMAAAWPLPATATFAVISTANYLPCVGVSFMATH